MANVFNVFKVLLYPAHYGPSVFELQFNNFMYISSCTFS